MAGTMPLDEAMRRLAGEEGGGEALVEIINEACYGSAPWRGPDGRFQIDPQGDLRPYEYDERVTRIAERILSGVDPDDMVDSKHVAGLKVPRAYRIEAYGKTWEEVTEGMGAKEAAAELTYALQDAVADDVRESWWECPPDSWAPEATGLAAALAEELGAQVGDDLPYPEFMDSLDELSLLSWDLLPTAADVSLPVELDFGGRDAGLAPETVRDVLEGRVDPADLDEDEVASTPLFQLAEQQGVSLGALISADAYREGDGRTVADDLKHEGLEASGSDWCYVVSAPATITGDQYAALTRGTSSDSLALRPGPAVVGLNNPWEGCGGMFGLDLARPLAIMPKGAGGVLPLSEVSLVDPERDHKAFVPGERYTIADINGFSSEIYDVTAVPEADAVADWALSDIAGKEARAWDAADPARSVDEVAEREAVVHGQRVGFGVAAGSTDSKRFDALDVSVYTLEEGEGLAPGENGQTLPLSIEAGRGPQSASGLLRSGAPDEPRPFAAGAAHGIAMASIDLHEREARADARGLDAFAAEKRVDAGEALAGSGERVTEQDHSH